MRSDALVILFLVICRSFISLIKNKLVLMIPKKFTNFSINPVSLERERVTPQLAGLVTWYVLQIERHFQHGYHTRLSNHDVEI